MAQLQWHLLTPRQPQKVHSPRHHPSRPINTALDLDLNLPGSDLPLKNLHLPPGATHPHPPSRHLNRIPQHYHHSIPSIHLPRPAILPLALHRRLLQHPPSPLLPPHRLYISSLPYQNPSGHRAHGVPLGQRLLRQRRSIRPPPRRLHTPLSTLSHLRRCVQQVIVNPIEGMASRHRRDSGRMDIPRQRALDHPPQRDTPKHNTSGKQQLHEEKLQSGSRGWGHDCDGG